MGKQHVIELNGKRYDALTGKMLTTEPVAASSQKSKATPMRKGGSIDGFARPTGQKAAASNRNANPAPAHKAQKSKTLMRTTVAKPKPVKHEAKATTKPAVSSATHTSATDQKRMQHAKSIPRSPSISRFSAAAMQAASKAVPSSHKSTTKATQPAAQATAVAAPVTATATQSLVDKALANSTPHEAPKLKKEKRSARIGRKLHISPRLVSAGGFAVAALLIIGFFTYQNATNISMRIASSRAGVQASLPGYQPAGFKVAGGIAYNPGQVTIAYKSTTDDRNFKLTQNVSDWNSQALLDNYVASAHPNNQTVQDRGKTVYLYDGSNATWVDGGIWYRIEGESQLNSDQLLNIAASL